MSFRVWCKTVPSCGYIELSAAERDKQLQRDDQQHRCPKCNDLAISENQENNEALLKDWLNGTL